MGWQVAKALLCSGKGIDVEIKDGEGRTALMHASEAGQAAVVALLLSHKADAGVEDQEGLTAIALAARHGHVETVRLLVLAAPPCGRSLGAALMEACCHGHVEAAEALIGRCNKDVLRPAMLVTATAGGHSALVDLLVRRVQENDGLDATSFLFPACVRPSPTTTPTCSVACSIRPPRCCTTSTKARGTACWPWPYCGGVRRW